MTTHILTPLALQNEDVLRALAANRHGGADKMWSSVKQLAEYLGRDDSNLGKSLRALHEAGLIYQPASWNGLTADGAAVVAALDRAAGAAAAAPAAAATPSGYVSLIWMQIDPDPLNPRKHFDEAEIEELANSIARDGLLENLVVRPGVVPDEPFLVDDAGDGLPMHRLVAGERRHRAIKRLIERGEWMPGAEIVCKVVDIDDAAHRRLALVENLQRKDLRPIDEALALQELMTIEKVGTADIAKDIGFTQRFVQQRLQLLDLPPELKTKVNAGELSIERGREAAAMWPKLPPIKQVELREGKITVEACRKWLSDQPEALEIDDDQLLILAEVAWAVAAKPAGYWTTTTCDYRVEGLPRQMEKAQLLQFSKIYYGPDEGMVDVRLTRESFDQVRRLCGADDQLNRTALEPLVRRARVKVIGGNPLSADYRPDAHKDVDRLFKEKRFHTPWLNKPFQMDPQTKAARDKTKAEQVKLSRERAERDAADLARRETALAESAKVLEEADELCMELAQREPAAANEALPGLFDKVGSPLPWRTDERGTILDAGGGVVLQGWYYEIDGRTMASRRLICAAVNAAAGATFDAAGAPPPALTREAYLTRVAAELLEAETDDGGGAFPDMAIATDAAGRALDALLERQGLTFPDPEEDWDLILDDVVEAALNTAVAAMDDDVALSPKLLELAGVPAAATEAEAG